MPEPIKIVEDSIPSIHRNLNLRHLHANGKILSDTVIRFYKEKMAREKLTSISFDVDNVYGKIFEIEGKYYATYDNSPLGSGARARYWQPK